MKRILCQQHYSFKLFMVNGKWKNCNTNSYMGNLMNSKSIFQHKEQLKSSNNWRKFSYSQMLVAQQRNTKENTKNTTEINWDWSKKIPWLIMWNVIAPYLQILKNRNKNKKIFLKRGQIEENSWRQKTSHS